MRFQAKFTRLVLAVPLVIGAVAVGTPAALAAAPSNDTFAGATTAFVGFSDLIDTSQATTDADDAQLNASCGAPATDASVWYAFSSPTDTGVVVDVTASNYSAGILVGTGTEGNLATGVCGPFVVRFSASAGVTYYVLAIDDQSDGGGNGGNLNIMFNAAPPPPTVGFTVNSTGTVNSHTGVATISGTYTCTNGNFIQVQGTTSQNVGRFTITGFFFLEDLGTCDGTSHAWSADAIPTNGKFAGGKAMTATLTIACGPFDCGEAYMEQTIQLKGGKK